LHKTGLILALLSAVASIYDPARKGLLGPGDGHAPGAFHFGGLFLLQNLGWGLCFQPVRRKIICV